MASSVFMQTKLVCIYNAAPGLVKNQPSWVFYYEGVEKEKVSLLPEVLG